MSRYVKNYLNLKNKKKIIKLIQYTVKTSIEAAVTGVKGRKKHIILANKYIHVSIHKKITKIFKTKGTFFLIQILMVF